ncbi:hypothetical protein A3F65_03565 [Candidatus Saccharibacteria bacterium RIFCSPHIGHO2_12_FULL_47_16b]|nr:MAG: hypothetical protein A3F65_03565 [Candidatus Saccharibacteria bacterium RIFCSPHIGHO2_12_FULL_47_16b]
MIRKLMAALILAVLTFLAFGQTSTTAQSAYSFEFYDFQTNSYVTTFPFGHSNEIIVASQTQDVRNQLPISLSLRIDGTEKWTATIANDPTQNCRDATGCSTRGPKVSNPGADSFFELTAMIESGQNLATYASGTPPSRTSETTTTSEQPTNQSSTTTSSNSWWQWWWGAGFVVGILWLFPWVFVGWQWSRFRLWGFGWPWPWWFWIPLLWFIPWLIIGWIWWLDWWLWWAWLWWLFPWFFWWVWWVIVFKEFTIWLWRQTK